MPTDTLSDVTVTTRANLYFDGKCMSHSLTLADGTKKSVGVILPSSTLHFATGAAETMECVCGRCEYRLEGAEHWQTSSAGERFDVAADSSFEIRVADEPYHYVCHFG